MSEQRRQFTEKEYLLVVLVGVAVLMAATAIVLVVSST